MSLKESRFLSSSFPIWDSATSQALCGRLFEMGYSAVGCFTIPETKIVKDGVQTVNEVLTIGQVDSEVVFHPFNPDNPVISFDNDYKMVVFNSNSHPVNIQSPGEKQVIEAGGAIVLGEGKYQIWLDEDCGSSWSCILVGRIK